jgi:hypothetical protein
LVGTDVAPGVSPPSPASLLALQRSVGNQGVVALLKSAPATPQGSESDLTIRRFRDFGRAKGTPTSDYKILDGEDATYGKYHIKFHNEGYMDVFDEIHIVFEGYARNRGYFFYDDDGVLIRDKSSGLDNNDAALTKRAQELVDVQLSTSNKVADSVVEQKRTEKAEAEARAGAQKEKWAAEDAEKADLAAKRQEAERAASAEANDRDVHINNFMADIGLPSGEKTRFVAYIDGKGESQAHWKVQADWFRENEKTKWSVRLPETRLAKAKSITPKEVRDANKVAEGVSITFEKKKSGRFVVWTPVIHYSNYTRYITNPTVKKAPAVK